MGKQYLQQQLKLMEIELKSGGQRLIFNIQKSFQLSTLKNIEANNPNIVQNRLVKQKRIQKKPASLLHKLTIESPIAFKHVYNYLNIGLNELSLQDRDYQESFFKSMFYTRTVEKVEIRKHAVILQLTNSGMPPTPTQYLINRYKSFGNKDFYELACKIEEVGKKFDPLNFKNKLAKSFDSEPLSRFIDSMQGEIYMCRAAPNKLVISRPLLELLGEDLQLYAIQICKYKMPLREIISSEHYSQVIIKSLENFGLICDFLNNLLSLEQLHASTSIEFDDYLITRSNKKVYAKLSLYMPTPLMSCVHVREVINSSDDFKTPSRNYKANKYLIEKECQRKRYSESQILKNIVKMPNSLLQSNEQRLAGYCLINQGQQVC